MQDYKPQFLSWAKSYEQEVAEMRELIAGNPADVKQLKEEYRELTGKMYRKILSKKEEFTSNKDFKSETVKNGTIIEF